SRHLCFYLLNTSSVLLFFFFNTPAPPELYTLSLTTLFRSPPLGRRPTHAAPRTSSEPRERELRFGANGASPWGSLHQFLLSRERSEEHTSELQSRSDLVCRLLLEKKKKRKLKQMIQKNN